MSICSSVVLTVSVDMIFTYPIGDSFEDLVFIEGPALPGGNDSSFHIYRALVLSDPKVRQPDKRLPFFRDNRKGYERCKNQRDEIFHTTDDQCGLMNMQTAELSSTIAEGQSNGWLFCRKNTHPKASGLGFRAQGPFSVATEQTRHPSRQRNNPSNLQMAARERGPENGYPGRWSRPHR